MELLAQHLALALQVGAAGMLLLAGSAKLAEPSAIRHVLSGLGLATPSAAAFLLGFFELGTGLAILLLPGDWIAAGLVTCLGLTFGTAAALALGRGLQVDCACFGSSLSAPLGWRQLALAPLWLVVAATVLAEPAALTAQRPSLTFVVVAVIAIGALARLLPLLTEHRSQWRAIAEA